MTTLTATSRASRPEIANLTDRGYSLIAGVGYVLLFVLAIFANFFVREGLIVAGDASATAANLADSEGLFRVGMIAFLAIFLIDVAVSWALYIVFRPVNQSLSLLAAWFRIVYTVFLGVGLVFFFQALQLVSGDGFLSVFTVEQTNAQALVALDTFNSTWLIGLAAFGIHLVVLGAMVIISGVAPRALGVVLAVAGVTYVIDTAAHTLLGNYADYASVFLMIVLVPSVLAEGWFGLWLLTKGRKDTAGQLLAGASSAR